MFTKYHNHSHWHTSIHSRTHPNFKRFYTHTFATTTGILNYSITSVVRKGCILDKQLSELHDAPAWRRPI